MKAILLAAGLGTRLRPLTETIPKCLMPIRGRPLLDYWIEKLISVPNISEILINTHYLADQVRDFIDQHHQGLCITLSHEHQLLGTAGTVKKHSNWLNNQDFMLIHADNYSSLNLAQFIDAHHRRPSDCMMSMTSFVTDQPSLCGIIECDNQQRVVQFHEKKSGFYGYQANGAVYICTHKITEYIKNFPTDTISFSDDIIPQFMGKIYNFPINGYHIDIGNMDNLTRAQGFF